MIATAQGGSAELPVGPLLAAVLVILALAAALVVRAGSLRLGREILVAAVRAAAQLAAVSLVIGAALRSLGLTFVFVTVMVAIATATAGHRVAGSVRGGLWAAAPIVGGSLRCSRSYSGRRSYRRGRSPYCRSRASWWAAP